jgi:antitoxin MazE
MYIPTPDRSLTSQTTRSGEPPVRATVSRWGNSLGLRIPRGLAEDAGLTEGSPIDLRVENGRLIIEPVAIENLESLLAKVTPKNLHGELRSDAPRGREVW